MIPTLIALALIITFRLCIGKIKWSILKTVLFSKKYLLLTGRETVHIITNYSSKEISHSGNAIYILKNETPPKKTK